MNDTPLSSDEKKAQEYQEFLGRLEDGTGNADTLWRARHFLENAVTDMSTISNNLSSLTNRFMGLRNGIVDSLRAIAPNADLDSISDEELVSLVNRVLTARTQAAAPLTAQASQTPQTQQPAQPMQLNVQQQPSNPQPATMQQPAAASTSASPPPPIPRNLRSA